MHLPGGHTHAVGACQLSMIFWQMALLATSKCLPLSSSFILYLPPMAILLKICMPRAWAALTCRCPGPGPAFLTPSLWGQGVESLVSAFGQTAILTEVQCLSSPPMPLCASHTTPAHLGGLSQNCLSSATLTIQIRIGDIHFSNTKSFMQLVSPNTMIS